MIQTITDKYEKWLKADLPDDLRSQLMKLSDDEINDCFYKDLEFGTGGMRGVMGPGSNRLNIYVIRKVTRALALYCICNSGKSRAQGIVISHDNRLHSREFTLEAAKMLSSYGIKVYIFDDLRPTPELSFAVRKLGATAGIMITASHNPKEYNGYKVYDRQGCQLTPGKLAPFLDLLKSMGNEIDTQYGDYKPAGEIITLGKEIDKSYISRVKSILLNKDLDKSNLKIVFTPQHGTSLEIAKKLFKDLKYRVTYVTEQCTHDPLFSATDSPNPEMPEAYNLALEYAKKVDADIIMATDPDADRCGIVIKDKNGNYRLFTGNETGAMLIDYVLSQRKALGKLHENGIVFDTVVTSSFGRKIAEYYNMRVESVLTGFKYIGEKIRSHEKARDYEFEFGYEESYGYLLADFVRDKDSLQALIMILEMTNYYLLQGKTLDVVYDELQQKFGYHRDKLYSIYFEGQFGKMKMDSIMEGLRNNPIKEICGNKLAYFEDYSKSASYNPDGEFINYIELPPTDLLKFYFDDGSTIAIRPSGTEPKCKFYYGVVGKSQEEVDKKPDAFHEEVKNIIGL